MSKNQEFDVYVDFLNYLNNTEVKKVKELAAYTKDIHKLDWSPTCIKKINAKGHQQSGMLFYAFGEVSEHWIELMVATKDAMPSHTRVGEWIDDFFINDKKGADNNGLISYVKKYIETSSCKVKEFGEVMTPISLVQDMLDKLPEEVWSNPDYKWLDPCAGIGTFASCVVPRLMEGLKNVEGLKQTQKRYNHIINNMLYACELQERNAFIYTFLMNPFKQGNKVCTNIYRGSFLDEGFDNHMKDVWELTGFDVVIGNPPYQELKEGNKKSQAIWHLFVDKGLSICSKNFSMVHPDNWRAPSGQFKDIQQKMLNAGNMLYLEMHNKQDGIKTFGATTTYDFYVIDVSKNTPSFKTTVLDNEETVSDVCIKNLEFIPNARLTDFKNLLADTDEEKVEVFHDWSKYESRKEWISSTKCTTYKYPVVYTTKIDGSVNMWWSSTKDNGHYGISKVIFSNGISTPLLDLDGKYAQSQFAYSIVDSKANLPKIKKALESDKFIELMKHADGNVGHRYNRRVMAEFRKDFWKDFV